MSALKGYASQGRIGHVSGSRENFVSVLQTDPKNRAGMDVLPKALYFVDVAAKTAEAVTQAEFPGTPNALLRIIKLTGALAAGVQKGDVLRFISSGSNPNMEVSVEVVTTDHIFLAGELLADPDTEDFFHMRHITLSLTSGGSLTVSPDPIKYVLNGVDTEVTKDTATPANDRPLPVENLTTANNAERVIISSYTAAPTIPVTGSRLAGPVVPAGFRATELEILTKSGDNFTAYTLAAAGTVIARFTQAGGRIPVNIAAAGEIHLESDGDGFVATDLTINVIGVPA